MNLGEKIQLISTLSNLQSDRFFNKQDFCISELDKIENRMQYSFQPDRPKLELNLAHTTSSPTETHSSPILPRQDIWI